MKKKLNLTGKLNLNKETIVKLNQENEKNILGGGILTLKQTCKDSCGCTTPSNCMCLPSELKNCITVYCK